MKIRFGLLAIAATLLCSGMANAATMRVVVVETSDIAAYSKAVLTDGQALLKKKGSQGQLRMWVGTFAGPNAGSVIVSVEYPNLEALAKETALMRGDADLRAWLEGLGKIRKIVSDSIYEEVKP